MDKKFRGKVINALRRLTRSYPPRNVVKRNQKAAPSTYQCEKCSVHVYEGLSETKMKEHGKILDTNIIKGKVHIDHIVPVIPIGGFKNTEWDWNEYMSNLFCDKTNLQVLCEECHKEKTMYENELRKIVRRKKKLDNEEI
jgi:5-methylcytosine-specific restriction endonuclease McrA